MLRCVAAAACGFTATAAWTSAPRSAEVVQCEEATAQSATRGAEGGVERAKPAPLPKGVTGKIRRQAITGAFKKFTLGEIIPITHDVALLRFLLPEASDEFTLQACSTLQAYFKTGNTAMDEVMRFYTPVTVNGTKGYFDIIVKRKPQGRMTSHLLGLHVGDEMMFRCVAFKVKYDANRWQEVGMIAGGTGFTPMLQVINHALRDASKDAYGKPDRTKLSFLFCNRTERHILLRPLFDRLQRQHPDRFRMAYSIDAPIDAAKWDGYVGYLTEQMVRETMPPPSQDGKSIILLCGPDQLLSHAAGVPMSVGHTLSGSLRMQPVAPDLVNLSVVGGVLGKLGYDASQVYKF
jgi:cytochrome-b5 reductase